MLYLGLDFFDTAYIYGPHHNEELIGRFLKSTQTLEACSEAGILIINPIICGEVGAICDSLEELNSLLPVEVFRRDEMIWEASFLAGQVFSAGLAKSS